MVGRPLILHTSILTHYVDTTARTLDACLALLALHEAIQDQIYEEKVVTMPVDEAFVGRFI